MTHRYLAGSVWFFLIVLSGLSETVIAQQASLAHPADAVRTCYLSDQVGTTRIPAPDVFLRSQRTPNGRLAAATAQFIVEYNGFTAEARQAFQFAVDIWATQIVSPVPIRIQANWVSQEPGALGSAYPATYRAGTDGVQKGYGYYPIALAEKIARRPINSDNEPDVIANINRNNDWYYGTDGKPLRYQYDLVTAVLHELAHGLGVIGFFDVKNGTGQYAAGLPSVYDHFIAKGAGNVLPWRAVASLTTLPNNSAALGAYLTSGNLYFDAPKTRRRYGIIRPFLAAPNQFNRAESLYHLDQSFYESYVDDRLMLPRQKEGDAIHSLGPVLRSMLDDLEWQTTSVLYEPLVSSERNNDLTFSLRVVSDTSRSVAAPRLLYRKSRPTPTDTAVTSVPLTLVGSSGEYRYTMSATQAQGEVWYYLSAQDALGRAFTNPGKTPSNAQLFYRVQSGPDNVPPVVRHNPSRTLLLNPARPDSLPILATISDDRPAGISSAIVDYQLNGVAQPPLPLTFAPAVINGVQYDSLYRSRLNFSANTLKPGDRITYRIIARDASQIRNQTISPASGAYEIWVVSPQAPRDRYVTDFNSAGTLTSDFALSGFTVSQPPEFGDPALHSAHPYQNGSDFRRQSSVEATLLIPIQVMANPDSAVVRFDEIALIQPGQAGSQFGQPGFNDYAVVEGSNDNGQSWRPLADGYNALDQADWLAQYNRNLLDGTQPGERNSTSAGVPALFRRRVVPLLSANGFRPGEAVLIRFRLLADAANTGWGWAIDNLRIQAPALPLVLANEPVATPQFAVFPNPVSTGLLQIEADLVQPVQTAELLVLNVSGQVIRRDVLRVGGLSVRYRLDLGPLPAGLYVIRLAADEVILTQRISIVR